MEIYVLILSDGTVSGIYSTKDKLIADLTTVFAPCKIKSVEVWDIDKGFVEYLNIHKTTTVTIED